MMVPLAHGGGLRFLFGRAAAVSAGGALGALWWLAMSDAWRCNGHMPAVARARALLDDAGPRALCYRPMGRATLTRLLRDRGLMGKAGLFTDAALTALYAALEEAHAASLMMSV